MGGMGIGWSWSADMSQCHARDTDVGITQARRRAGRPVEVQHRRAGLVDARILRCRCSRFTLVDSADPWVHNARTTQGALHQAIAARTPKHRRLLSWLRNAGSASTPFSTAKATSHGSRTRPRRKCAKIGTDRTARPSSRLGSSTRPSTPPISSIVSCSTPPSW